MKHGCIFLTLQKLLEYFEDTCKILKKILIALFLLGVGFSCTKTTIVDGIVTDAGTGLPIPRVVVELTAIGGKYGNKQIDFQVDKTDSLGRFILDVGGKKMNYASMTFQKDGYGPIDTRLFKSGEKISDMEITLYPYDAVIQLELHNVSGASTFFHHYTGVFYGKETDSGPLAGYGALQLATGAKAVEFMKVLGGGQVDIIWATSQAAYNNAPQKVSVFCPRSDTTIVNINY